MKTRILLAAMTIALVCARVQVQGDEQQYQQGLRSTAWIVAGEAQGSGVLVDLDRKLVVTNYHVISGADQVKVCFTVLDNEAVVAERTYYEQNLNEISISGRVTAKDPRRDLALIELEKLPESAVAAQLALRSPTPGEQVYSIGNPGSSEALWVYTSGSVRQVYDVKMSMPSGIPLQARIIETQSPVNPGDSGGPAFNSDGELVGVVQSFLMNARLVSRCIDVSEVRALLSGDIKSWDQRVSGSLDKLKLRYTINPFGVFNVSFRDSEQEESVVVFVDSDTYAAGSSQIRDVKSRVFTGHKPLPGTVANELLIKSSQYSLGSWCVNKADGKFQLWFVARIDAGAPAQTLKDAIAQVLDVAGKSKSLIARLQAAEQVDPDALIGTWVGQITSKKQKEVKVQIRFLADGSFSFDNQTVLLRGSFQLVAGEVRIQIGEEHKTLGAPRFLDTNRLLLNLGSGDVDFARQIAQNSVPADAITLVDPVRPLD